MSRPPYSGLTIVQAAVIGGTTGGMAGATGGMAGTTVVDTAGAMAHSVHMGDLGRPVAVVGMRPEHGAETDRTR